MKFTTKFRIGIILLAINQPFGWGVMLFCAALAVKTKKTDLYFWGIAAYALSWGMFGLGLLLTGREGIDYSRMLSRRAWDFFLRVFNQSLRLK